MSAGAPAAARFVGQSVPRVEDDRVLTGRGRYVGDIVLPGLLHAAFVRSPLAHATVNGIDVESARSLPGIVAVLTEADLGLNPLRNAAEIPGYLRPVFSALATDRVRYVGDPVALVIAESRAAAEDGCELVDVDYEPIECGRDDRERTRRDAPAAVRGRGLQRHVQRRARVRRVGRARSRRRTAS